MGATLLGALAALQLDLLLAIGDRLMHPAGQQALLKTIATAALAGLLCWVACALATRAIRRHALRPYNALASHFERLADGHVDRPLDLRRSDPAVRRLARAAFIFHQRDLASRRSTARLQARYDALCQEQADERRLLMGMLMSGRLDSAPRSTEPSAPPGFDVPEPPAVRDSVSRPTMDGARIVDLAGRLRSSPRGDAAPAAEPVVPDAMPLDFVFVRR